MPPAASICIINEVPERGSPETIVITSLRYLSGIGEAPSESGSLGLRCCLRPFLLRILGAPQMIVCLRQRHVRIGKLRQPRSRDLKVNRRRLEVACFNQTAAHV